MLDSYIVTHLHDNMVTQLHGHTLFVHAIINPSKSFEVKLFSSLSLRNWEVANVLISHVNQISSLLSNPKSGLIKPLKIDYNLIEVLPAGTCFHTAGKRFECPEKLKPGYFPRAFIEYVYDKDKVPNPKPFIEGKLSYFTLIVFHRYTKLCS